MSSGEPAARGGIVSPGTYQRDILSVPTQKFLFTLVLDRGSAGQKRSMEARMAVGGFGPAEGLGVGIAGVDASGDHGLSAAIERCERDRSRRSDRPDGDFAADSPKPSNQ